MASAFDSFEPASAQPPSSHTVQEKPGAPGFACTTVQLRALDSLDETLEANEFRIFYAQHGKHSVVDTTDSNGNGRPDLIDDLSLQLTTARDFYHSVFGLKHPLAQPRYVNAKRINVFVLAMENGNGAAFDEPVVEQIRQDKLACGLRIIVSNQIRASQNLTPAHELFHLYQYGYAMFKSRWYLEGMARWIESAFYANSAVKRSPQQQSTLTCEDSFDASYAAAAYWKQLAESASPHRLSIPESLSVRRYSDGRPVFDTTQFKGGDFVRPALEALASATAAVEVASAQPRFKWPETLQQSDRFDPLICERVEQVAAKMRAR